MKFSRISSTWLAAGALSICCASAQADVVLDLRGTAPSTPPNPSSGAINDATYYHGSIQPAGSGVIDSFVRVQTNQTTVQGYNTTANNVFDTGATNTFNHAITVGQVGFIGQVNGEGGVMQFILDINQIGSPPSSYLSLDEVQVFISTAPNQSVETFDMNGLVAFPGASTKSVYRMDAGGDNQVLLDYDWFGGSGSSDMTLELTRGMFDTAFAALGLTTNDEKNGAYIYLYSKFGLTNVNNDGYEEWAYKEGAGTPVGCIPSEENNFCRPQEVPEPGTLALLGLALAAAGIAGRRKA